MSQLLARSPASEKITILAVFVYLFLQTADLLRGVARRALLGVGVAVAGIDLRNAFRTVQRDTVYLCASCGCTAPVAAAGGNRGYPLRFGLTAFSRKHAQVRADQINQR